MSATAPPLTADAQRFAQSMRAPRLRTMREFAEQELIIPDGPYQGERFNVDTQPYARLALDAMDGADWNKFAAVGPSQTGKTLLFFVLPLLYHLFEMDETVICGVPSLDVVADKWRDDIKPAIESTRYRECLPTQGPGSRDGDKPTRVSFTNGAVLRFMTAGGGDKARAAFTSRVLIITELDGFDKSAKTSREADKVSQLIARTEAYGSRKRIYMECTASTTKGRIWKEFNDGSAGEILVPCPACKKHVLPEREHLVGWESAENILDARDAAEFACPSCGALWSESERVKAVAKGLLIHRGQEVKRGKVTGPLPRTDTMGFRWSAVHNLFQTAGDLGMQEWRADRDPDEENAKKQMLQFYWAKPYDPPMIDLTSLEQSAIIGRQTDDPRGYAPADTEYLGAAMDLGKHLCYWGVVAMKFGVTPHVVDYGVFDTYVTELGTKQALMTTMERFAEMVYGGWKFGSAPMSPKLAVIDSGGASEGEAWSTLVYRFCKEHGIPFLPFKGFGVSQDMGRKYTHPTKRTNQIRAMGDEYHVTKLQEDGVFLLRSNVDHWKTHVHEALQIPTDQEGAMTLFQHEDRMPHRTFAKHLTAEKQVKEFVAGVGGGDVVHWEKVRKDNHFLDVMHMALVGCDAIARDFPCLQSQTAKGKKWYANSKGRRR